MPKLVAQVLVTGASSGIGAAVAIRLAAQGAAVTLLGRDRARLARTARLARAAGAVAARCITVDLAYPARIERVMARLRGELAHLDALVHAAGVFLGGSVLDPEQRSFHTMLQVNAHATLAITRALVPLLEARRGTVVFINSAGVQRPPLPLTARYIAGKHLLLGITEALREELNPRGIRVTSIYPARTATPMQQALQRLEGRVYQTQALLQPDDVAGLIACAVNLPPHVQLVDLLVRPMSAPVPTAGAARRRSVRARR
ncbi:MAG TPA: SDR family NAD(P)-dependent oxidoreductase [Steroidobacteraceae bacterium]|nr:SDR family NAD(P)-dependent oxidoreductase [Steroidobacteraceae bacterium]